MATNLEVGPDIAMVAQLLSDRTRALMVRELASHGPLSATSLAVVAGVSRPTASEHLTRLVDGGVLCVERVGRHAYYRLTSRDVAVALKALNSLAPEPVDDLSTTAADAPPTVPAATGEGWTCYDHIGGHIGAELTEAMQEQGLVRQDAQCWEVDVETWDRRQPLGIACAPLQRSRRPIVSGCVGWNDRRDHVAGSLAAAVATQLFQRGWLVRTAEKERLVASTRIGEIGLRGTFGIVLGTSS